VTQRSVLTTQSKLTVQAPSLGSGVHPSADSILLKNTPTAIISTGDYRAKCAILGAMAAAHILVRCPVSGVGSFNGSLLGCFRKDVALCHTASRAWVGERRTNGERRTENGELGWTAHFMCTVCVKHGEVSGARGRLLTSSNRPL